MTIAQRDKEGGGLGRDEALYNPGFLIECGASETGAYCICYFCVYLFIFGGGGLVCRAVSIAENNPTKGNPFAKQTDSFLTFRGRVHFHVR